MGYVASLGGSLELMRTSMCFLFIDPCMMIYLVFGPRAPDRYLREVACGMTYVA